MKLSHWNLIIAMRSDIVRLLDRTLAVDTTRFGERTVAAPVDPGTLQAREVFAHAGPPLGLATVAVQAGADLYVGSAAGDRVLRVPAGLWMR